MGQRRKTHSAFRPSTRVRELIACLLLGAGLSIGIGQDARAQIQCDKTGAAEVTAISEAEYDSLAAEAGADACVTPRSSGLTLCQMPPLNFGFGSETWTVVAEAPAGGGDAQSTVEFDVYSAQVCKFYAGTAFENTDSRWIKATTSFTILEDSSSQLDFVAVVQIGPGNQTTATVCPFGDGADGHDCSEWNGQLFR